MPIVCRVASVCFCVVPIGPAITVPSTGTWIDYPPNTQLTFLADGFLSLYVNGNYAGCDFAPAIKTNKARTDAQVDIYGGYGVAHVKFDVYI